MKYILLISWLVCGLSLTCSQANDLPTPKRSAGGTRQQGAHSVTVSPVSASYTVGQSVTLTITGGTSGTAYSVNLLDENDQFISGGISYLSDQGTNNTFTWPAGASSYSMVVTFLQSALSSGTLDRVLDVSNLTDYSYAGSDIFTVLPKPTLSLTLSPVSGTYAVGNSVTATLTGGIVGEKYVVMLYSDAAYTTNLSQQISPTTSQSGVNTITWTETTTSEQFYVQFEAGSEGTGRVLEVTNLKFLHLVDSSPFTVAPCSSVVSVSATPSLTVLSGSSLTLTASRGVNYPVDSFTWSTGESTSAITISNVTSATAFTVTAVTGSCSGTASVAVSIMQIPPISLTLSATPAVVCAGGSVGLSVLASGGIAPFSYSWVAPSGATISGSTNLSAISAIASISGVQTFTVTVASAGGLPTSTSVVSITVNSTPQVSIAPSTTTIGGGHSATLTASGADNYNWDSGDTGPILIKTLIQTTVYSVTGLNTQGCAGTASATVIVDCGELIQAKANLLMGSGVLGPNNCTVSLQGIGYGTGYTLTGPGGYVFSAVYRKLGGYSLTGLNVKLPGTYTFTVSYTDVCERITTDTMTYVVTGTACK